MYIYICTLYFHSWWIAWNVGWPQNPEKGWWTVILFKQWSYLILFTPSWDWQHIFFCLVLGSCDPCVSLGDVIHGKLSRILWAASLRHAALRMWTVPCVLDEHVLNMLCVTIFLLHFFVNWVWLSFPDFLSRKWSIPRKATNWNHLIKLSLIGILYDSFILHKRCPYFPTFRLNQRLVEISLRLQCPRLLVETVDDGRFTTTSRPTSQSLGSERTRPLTPRRT